MYTIKRTDLRIQNAFQNVIEGRPDASSEEGKTFSLKKAIEIAIELDNSKEEFETHARICNDSGEIVIGANEMDEAFIALKQYVKPDWREAYGRGTPTVFLAAEDQITETDLRKRMNDHYYGNVK